MSPVAMGHAELIRALDGLKERLDTLGRSL